MLKNLNELHGKKSKCGKFTINIDKGYLAVACNFHDGKDRIVYSESLENIENILQDIHRVWNFKLYIIMKQDNNDRPKLGITILYDKHGNKMALRDVHDGTMKFTHIDWVELFYNFESWDLFVDSVLSCGGNIVEI